MTYARTLEFASEDGVEITVSIRSPTERISRVAAVESAMINACHLYPMHDRGGKPDTKYGFMPYWACIVVGLLMPSVSIAMLLWMPRYEGAPPMDPSLRTFLLTVALPALTALCVSLLAFVEWRARSFGTKVRKLRAQRTELATA